MAFFVFPKIMMIILTLSGFNYHRIVQVIFQVLYLFMVIIIWLSPKKQRRAVLPNLRKTGTALTVQLLNTNLYPPTILYIKNSL